MAKSVYWCSHCGVPVIENSKCPICGNGCKSISTTGICNPVFRQEKKLLSLILGADLLDNNVWYLGSSTYLIDGNRVRLPYVDFFKQKKHLLIADSLRDEIENNDEIPNLQLYLEANERYLNDAPTDTQIKKVPNLRANKVAEKERFGLNIDSVKDNLIADLFVPPLGWNEQ